ncbi:helix-turn-helix domain-containing protein [bacterium]|nr:helix-turn-helix domain-containing protein [bacterium]
MFAETADYIKTDNVPGASWRNSTPYTSRSVQTIEHGASLFFQGDDAEYVFEVVEGVVASYSVLADGRRQVHCFFFPGDMLGLTPDAVYHANTCSIGKSRVCSIPRAKLMQIAKERPEIAAKLFESATAQLVGMQDHFVLLGRKCAQEKVASFLSALGARYATEGADTVTFRLPMTRSEIGDYLGLTIETVSRTMTKLRIAGAINLPNPATVEVLSRRRLERLAGDGAGY